MKKVSLSQSLTLNHLAESLERFKKSASDSKSEVSPVILSGGGIDWRVNNPKPTNFDLFVPWACLVWMCPQAVTIKRVNEYSLQSGGRQSNGSRQSPVSRQSPLNTPHNVQSSRLSHRSSSLKCSESIIRLKSMLQLHGPTRESAVVITAYYNFNEYLTGIEISSENPIHRKIIQAISLCIPFHPQFSKISIRRGVSALIVRELEKMIPHSNLTELCLDDACVQEANYYCILNNTSPLKYVSLKRCGINDEACTELVSRISFGNPGSSLLALDLGSNVITDVGAKEIAQVLRQNRTLLHLDLSGNELTDEGATAIFTSLMKFRLTDDEILESRQRNFKYYEKKLAVSIKYKEEIQAEREKQEKPKKLNSKSPKAIKKAKESSTILETIENIIERTTLEIVGEDTNPFSKDAITKEGIFLYSLGNMVLRSLNLSYNNLTYLAVEKLTETVMYQQCQGTSQGLLRVMIEGNNIPRDCIEYSYLNSVLMPKFSVTSCRILETPKKTNSKMKKSSANAM